MMFFMHVDIFVYEEGYVYIFEYFYFWFQKFWCFIFKFGNLYSNFQSFNFKFVEYVDGGDNNVVEFGIF